MLSEPGGLSDLGPDAKRAWTDEVVRLVSEAQATAISDHFRLTPEDDWEDGVAVVDWDGFPKILQNCLGDERASRFCDWKTFAGDLGRSLGQDEYVEWRTVHDSSGNLVRVEFTTELSKYWDILAGHHPMTTLRILGRFAGEVLADWREVYGSTNPFDPDVTVEERSSAFYDMMNRLSLRDPIRSPYNNGQKAIAFLSKPVSSLRAAVQLFVRAAAPLGKLDSNGNEVRLSGPEAISSSQAITGKTQQAIDCRNSDPTMVGRMIEEVWDGRAVAFDDPVGVYIRNFNYEALIDPDGNSIPGDWIEYQRGSRPVGGKGQERSQRLVVEVPPGLGFVLGDLVKADTNERIEYGYQLAELLKAACYFKTSVKGEVTSPRNIGEPEPLADCMSAGNCEAWRGQSWEELYKEFEDSTAMPPGDAVEASRITGL